MNVPRDIPEWIVSLLSEQKETADTEVLAARTAEDLWRAQGKLRALDSLQGDIELRAIQEQEEARRIAEGISSHA